MRWLFFPRPELTGVFAVAGAEVVGHSEHVTDGGRLSGAPERAIEDR